MFFRTIFRKTNRLINQRVKTSIVLIALSLFSSLSFAEPIDKIIIIVNDDVITNNELSKEIRFIKNQLRQQQTPVPPDNVLEKQILERMIQKQLQLQLAEKARIRIAEETLDRTILKIASDNKLSLTEFRNVLENEGLDFEEYRTTIRDEITINQLRQREVYNKVNVTDQETEDFLANEAIQGGLNEEYRLAHILVEVPEAASSEQVQLAKKEAQEILEDLNKGADFTQVAASMSDGQNALEGGDLGWRTLGQLPTLFSNVITTMNVDDIHGLIRSPSGFHIIKLIDKRSNEQKKFIKQTRARHILVRTNELTPDREAKEKLNQLKKRIELGDSFDGLAKSHSDDTGSAAKGGALGWVSPGDMVPQFEKMLDATPENEISPPVKTQFGWHIIQVLERRDFDNTEKSKTMSAKNQIRQRKIEEETQNWLRRLRDEAYVEIRI
ncbi:MAG: molecular chaperone SurA [Gammaproteobacteria bacterium]|nr:molecular chaperone SurA [Gammaproteobacteria bacterium]